MESNEIWATIESNPDYSVSNLGRVRRDKNAQSRPVGHILKPVLDSSGYENVFLNRKRNRIHRLVAAAFCGPQPTPSHEVAHGDGTRRNNRADNLRWATGAIRNGKSAERAGCVSFGGPAA